MSNLAEAQNLAEAGGAGFTVEEHKRIMAFNIPGEKDHSKDVRYYPRKPVVNVKAWIADHSAKLTGLLRAERGR